MKPASLAQLKKELKHKSSDELEALVLRLTKHKTENKELLTYLLFEADDEPGFIERVKKDLDGLFEEINTKNMYYIKKGIRKILRTLKRYIRYSQNKETEVELLLYFCEKMAAFHPSVAKNQAMLYVFQKQKEMIAKKVEALHEDLQYDYTLELERIEM
ncbi:hypothetical protein ATE92_2182 [Ulvibacter sp. MAR_2010_11]|uniref:hypothetical protein n=1 Tax=Ulvibacter sp. MAR_2010_11 TaxID=1250229 RepID=UPI000C2BEBF2|nr:hypothetical protein [Ulvibacter sp. MAR_2010_11]PKA84012.1 hypothetical protein ATE92_2182 [Ulvibacter sp. MAR_2010_11]